MFNEFYSVRIMAYSSEEIGQLREFSDMYEVVDSSGKIVISGLSYQSARHLCTDLNLERFKKKYTNKEKVFLGLCISVVLLIVINIG